MKRILSCTLALLLALLPLTPQMAFAHGEYPEGGGRAVTKYSRMIVPSEVPVGTLLIGTHLIYRPVIYDKIYEMAMESASESGQTSVYYKSELAGGTWFEIGTATSVADITTKGAAVPDSVIAKLKYTHHTKADGTTYMILNGIEPYGMDGMYNDAYYSCKPKDYPINIYTYTKSWYNTEDFTEFISFNTAFDIVVKDEKTFNAVWIARQLMCMAWTEVVSWRGDQMRQLEDWRLKLIKEGASAQEWGVIAQLMEDMDNMQRIRYFKDCDKILDDMIKQANAVSGNKPPEMLMMSASNTQKALRASIAKLQGKRITVGKSTLENIRKSGYLNLEYTTRVSNFISDYPEQSKQMLQEVVNIENIMASNIVNREEELIMLNDLMSKTTYYYERALSRESNDDYDAAAKIPEAAALRERAINENNGVITTKQTELEQIILETIDRSSKVDGIRFLNVRIDEANKYYGKVSKGAFRDGGIVSVDAHIEFLRRLLKNLTGEESPEEKLQKEKLRLQDSLMEVLDENKTDEADEIRKKIDEVDKEIAAVEADNAAEVAALEEEIEKIEGEIKEADKEEAEKLAEELGEAKKKLADVKDGSDDSIIKVVEDLKKDAKDAIDSGDAGGVDIIIDILIPIAKDDPLIVVPAIKDIHDKMVDEDGGKDFKDQIKKAEDAIRDNADAVADAGKPKKEREIEVIVGEYDPQDDKRNAAVVAALGEYVYTEPGNGLGDLWKDWLDKLLADNNPYVFIRYNDGANEYIPYDVLGYFAGMRPVWYKTQQIGTLSKGGEYYSFKVDSTKVGRDKDSTKNDEMKITAKWQTVVHVHESYTKLKFDCEAFYIPNSIYGVLVSPEIKVMLDEIMGKIEDAGKPKQL